MQSSQLFEDEVVRSYEVERRGSLVAYAVLWRLIITNPKKALIIQWRYVKVRSYRQIAEDQKRSTSCNWGQPLTRGLETNAD